MSCGYNSLVDIQNPAFDSRHHKIKVGKMITTNIAKENNL
jgi:hypothetical protein